MGIFDRWRRRPPESAPERAIEVSTDVELVQEVLRAMIVPGFSTFEDAVDSVTELLEDDGVDTSSARSRLRAVWDARVRELALADPARPSDHDRVVEAFDVLERDHGFVTAMAAGFDRGELGDHLFEQRQDAGGTAWAGAGFHWQDAERLAETPATLYLLYLVFALAPGTPLEVVAAARQSEAGRRELAEADTAVAGGLLLEALRAAGLDATWNGSPASRIEVRITDWRRPLPTG